MKRRPARLAELEEKLPGLEEDAAAYAALKDRTATIELEAHRKAQETVEQAQARAAKTRSEIESWLRPGTERLSAPAYRCVGHGGPFGRGAGTGQKGAGGDRTRVPAA